MVYLSDIMQKKVRWWIAGGVILLLVGSAAFAISAQAVGFSLRFGGIINSCFFKSCLIAMPELVYPDCGIVCGQEQSHCLRCGFWCKQEPPLFPWGEVQVKPISDGAPDRFFCPVIWYIPFGRPFEIGQWLLGQSSRMYPIFRGVDSQIGVGDNEDKADEQSQYRSTHGN